MKLWTQNKPKSDKIILISENCIYKGNPKNNKFQNYLSEIKKEKIPNELFGIPYSYIKRIENPIDKNKIIIYYGSDSEEELNIYDKNVKIEIFEFLKQDIKNFEYKSETPSFIKNAKTQLFAILIITVLFSWATYLAIQIDNGAVYEMVGSGVGISGIVLSIAQLGTIGVLILFFLLLSIATLSLIRKNRKRTETEFLIRMI